MRAREKDAENSINIPDSETTIFSQMWEKMKIYTPLEFLLFLAVGNSFLLGTWIKQFFFLRGAT
jgi:hypothetical protein